MDVVRKIVLWIILLFKKESTQEIIIKPKKVRRKNKETLSTLLDQIDAVFDVVKLPTDRTSHLSRDTIRGLKRLGVHVPNPWIMPLNKNLDNVRIDTTRGLPAMMSICTTNTEQLTKSRDKSIDFIGADIMFAIKHEKLPWYISPTAGICYELGHSLYFEGKTFWMSAFLVIDRLGKMSIRDELSTKRHNINPKNGRHGITSFTTRGWGSASLLEGGHYSKEVRNVMIINEFKAMLDWWVARDSRWSVAITKGKDRITFGVNQEDTKIYFADRDKTIKTKNGKTKRIMHYVSSHIRHVNNKEINIDEHIRGLREFDWNAHHCIITAPKFHLTKLTSEFTIPAVDPEEKQTDTLSATRVGEALAIMEEQDRRY